MLNVDLIQTQNTVSVTVVKGSLGQQTVAARDEALIYANNAANSANAAANSAALAANSEYYAAISAFNAIGLADAAQASATAAAGSEASVAANAAAAAVSSASANTNAILAVNSALAANTSANNASISATEAAASALAANNSANNASISALQANVSAIAAAANAVVANTKANEASSSASAAAGSASAAFSSAAAANTSANNASISAAAANTSANNASISAAASAASALAANTSALNANTSAADATAKALAANNSATNAASSEYYASVSASASAASALAANNSAAQANNFANAASISAAASQSSRLASESARDASIVAKNASEAARDAALFAKTGAEVAQTNAELAETNAESAQAITESARDAAAISATQANNSANSASISATAAAANAASANTSRIAAETARTGSEAARDLALTYQTGAQSAQTASESARNLALTYQTGAQSAQTAAASSASAANISAGLASGSAASALAIYGSVTAQQAAVATAQAQASLAAGYAASASSVVQQDLSGITAQALHRSPNAITAMHIYDTSKDSDGGAWTEKCQHTSWWNEPLGGKWLGAQVSEFEARHGNGALGPELIVMSAGGGTTDWSFTGGKWVLTSASTNGQYVGFIALTAGKTYRVTAVVEALSGGTLTFRHPTASPPISSAQTVPGTMSFTFVASGTDLYIRNSAVGQTATVSSISVREVTALNTASNDYFQLTTDGKFYRLWKNLLSHTDALDNAAWSRTNATITPNPATNPLSGLGAQALIEATDTNLQHSVSLTTFFSLTGTYTVSVALKANGRNWAALNLTTIVGVLSTTEIRAWFDLQNGVVGTVLGAGTAAIQPLGDGFYRCSITVTYNSLANRRPIVLTSTGDGSVVHNGDGVSGILIGGFQLEQSATATTYEPKAAEGSTSEVFRGNKADFPRLAAIVAENMSVAVYDLTEPGRPMWMSIPASVVSTFQNHTSSSGPSVVSAMNGLLAIGHAIGNGFFKEFDFPSDKAALRSNGGLFRWINEQISARVGGSGGYRQVDGSRGVVNNLINAVAMTVLPDAPVDPATGLRVPTIALATGGGVSVIKHNGTVVNSGLTNSFNHVYLDKSILMFSRTGSRGVYFAASPATLGASFNASLMGSDPDQYQFQNPTVERFSSRTTPMRFATPSVHRKWNHEALPARGLNMAVSSTFNTGWLPGDIRRAYLSDATSESIGPGGNIVTNGDFATDVTGWTPMNGGSIVWSSGSAVVTGGAANTTGVYQPITCVVGKTYRFQVTVTLGTTTIVDVYVAGNATGGGGAVSGSFGYLTSSQTFIGYFTATATTHSVALQSRGVGLTATFDNVSVTEAVLDRSYKSATAPIFGTLTKAALATGTSLVGYSGFSAANYLREAYSPELEFGTGEWSCSAWVNVPVTGAVDANFNLIAAPENFADATWDKTGTNTIVANAATDPFGGNAATRFGSDNRIFFYFSTRIFLEQTAYTFSIYAKADVGSVLRVLMRDGFTPLNNTEISFNLATGTADNANVSMVDVGSGWYRCIITATTNSSFPYIELDTPTLANTVLIYGAKLNKGSTPGTYTPGRTAAYAPTNAIAHRSPSSGPAVTLGVNYASRLVATAFDGTTTRSVTTTAAYNTATWLKAEACYTTDGTLSIRVNGREVVTSRGNPLLSLNSRYNLLLNSEQFDLWGKNQVTVSSNATIAPNGTPTADLILDNTANAEHYVSQSFSCTNGIAYNFTGYLKQKPGSYSTCNVRTYLTGAVIHIVDFDAGTITNGGTLTSVGDGWYKFDITRTASATGTGYLETYTKQSGSNIGTGSDGHYAWGFQVAAANAWNNGYAYQRVGSATDFDFAAPLTIGNNFAADAPFPGSIALLKLSATVPTYEQSQFMYEQEKQLFRAGAQSVLPDSGAIIDMSYDDATDRWVAISATNESYWTGLVRNSVTPVPAGSYTRIVTNSGVELAARSTTNPGVDVTIPAYGLREELVKRAEAAARLTKELAIYDYVGGFTASTTTGSTAITSVANLTYPASYIGARISGSGIPTNSTIVSVSGTTIYISAPATATATGVSISFLDFELPVGIEAKAVLVAGALKQEGATKDYTRLYDGFIETIRFGTAPGATAWVQIQATRGTY